MTVDAGYAADACYVAKIMKKCKLTVKYLKRPYYAILKVRNFGLL